MTSGPPTAPAPGPGTPRDSAPLDIPGIELMELIGRGGFGTVYRARQVSVNREVAVKVDRRELTTESDRRRFLREVTATGQVSAHPNIVTLYDGGISPSNHPYMVMELCPGGSINDRLKGEGRFIAPEVIEAGIAIADALAAAHAVGILHRDVKPANILYTRYSKPALTDFGLASLPAEWGIETMSQAAFTPAYAPPEVFTNSAVSDSETGDVFSLGATLYSMLIGRPARWTESGPPSLSDIVILAQEPLPMLDIPGAPGLMDVLARATWPEVKLRTQSSAALRDELRWALGNLENGTARPGAPVIAGPAIAVGGIAAGALAAGALAASADQREAPAETPTGVLDANATRVLAETPTEIKPGGSDGGAGYGAAAGALADHVGADGPCTPVEAASITRSRWILATTAALVVALTGGGLWYFRDSIFQESPSIANGNGSGTEISAGASTVPSKEPGYPPVPLGKCSNGLTYISNLRTDLTFFDCAKLHYHESFATGVLEADLASPDRETVDSSPIARETCTAATLEEYAGRPIADPTINIVGPTKRDFDDGRLDFTCLVSLPGDQTTGSIKDG